MLFDNVATALLFDFYGLAFFVMGVSVLLVSEYSSAMFYTRHIALLAGFGFFMGIAGFLAGNAASANLASLSAPILVLRSVSFGFLIEYARRLWNQGPRQPVPLWLPPTLAGLVVTGVAVVAGDALAGIDAAERYFICLPVSCIIAGVLWRDSRTTEAELRSLGVHPWLLLLRIAFLLFGVLSLCLVLRLPSAPWLPTNLEFRQLFGFRVQLAHTIVAITIALSHFMLARLTARFVFRRSVENAALIANEEKYRALFEMSSDAILTFDQKRFIEVNHSCLAMFGYAHKHELLGLTLHDLSPFLQPDGSNSEQLMLAHIYTALARGTHRFEWMIRRHDGTTFPAEFQLTPIKLPAQELMQAIVRDIEAHKHSESELKMHRENLQELVRERTEEMLVAKTNAEKASAAKSEFLSRMSHELRTPLNAIIGFGQLLELGEAGDAAQQREYLRHIVAAGDHLLMLVNELLDLSRIESGNLQLSIESVALTALIEDAILQVSPLAEQRKLVFRRFYRDAAPFMVKADKTRLLQILLNLLSNAVKYNKAGGEVAIRLSAVADDNIRLAITDTGHGIASADLDRLFKPFERLNQGENNIEGTGIGLALTKYLTEAMQGSIGVDSVEAQGSTFWIELPRSTAAPALVGAGATDGKHPRAPSPHTMTLLLVEDNPLNVLLLERFFGNNPGYQLFTATDAQQGLELAVRLQPHLVLMDINLPGMDGFAALLALKANADTAHIPVIAISANAMPEQVARGRAAGFVDYFIKPLDLAELLNYLDRFKAPL